MHRLSISITTVAVIFLIISVASSPAPADDVTDTINKALKQYDSGELTGAVQSLDYASQLIQQKKGKQLEAFLPEPISGWKAEKATSQAMGSAMFRGGIIAERSYDKGDSHVSVKIITDSPMIQGMMMVFSNPIPETSDGGKLEKINGEKAIVKYSNEDKAGTVTVVIPGHFLITVEGDNVDRQDLTAFIQAIEFKKLAAMR